MQVLLDGIDVTAEMKRQLGSQSSALETSTPILPVNPRKWFDMLKIINSSPQLQEKFFDNGSLHTLTIRGSDAESFRVKMICRTTYSVRNS